MLGPQIQLRGPGDVLALNPAEIKRRVPEAGAVGAETNYFCAVEFFAPDLPWRYTPTAVADGQLSPWLVLVVVELGDGVTLSSGGRLPVLSVESPADHLPDLVDSWAWAHVQSAVPIDGTFAKTYDADPTAFTSRLLCPRRLRADTSYTACLVPAFASGRQAGLGLTVPATDGPAWTSAKVELPVYDSWELTAGDRFDFKTLAKRIKPAELPEDVGFRDLDLTEPGPGIRPLTTPATFVGAMHAPTESIEYWHDDDDRDQFEDDVRLRLVSSAPKRGREGAAYDPLVDDPVVTPTVYGAPQVGTSARPRVRGVQARMVRGAQHRTPPPCRRRARGRGRPGRSGVVDGRGMGAVTGSHRRQPTAQSGPAEHGGGGSHGAEVGDARRRDGRFDRSPGVRVDARRRLDGEAPGRRRRGAGGVFRCGVPASWPHQRPTVDTGERPRSAVAGDRHHPGGAPNVGARRRLGRRSVVDCLPHAIPAGRHGLQRRR